jgi:hypothetical protein
MSYSIPLYGYDPRGIVQAEARPLAPRVADLRGAAPGRSRQCEDEGRQAAHLHGGYPE